MLIFLSWLSVLAEDASCLSQEDFDTCKLRSGEEEASLEIGPKSWSTVRMT